MTERPGPILRRLLLGYTTPRGGTRRPLSSTEATLWLLLAYAAGPVGTLALSGLGVAGWVHAAHHRTVVNAEALSILGQVLVAVGVFAFAGAVILTSVLHRPFLTTVQVIGDAATLIWLVTASVGVAGPAWANTHVWAVMLIAAGWMLLLQGEVMARRVLAQDALARSAEAWKAAHPAAGSAAQAASRAWGGRS